MIRLRFTIIVLTSLVFLSGCAQLELKPLKLYDGPDRPAQETAKFERLKPAGSDFIDGTRSFSRFSHYLFLPGRHGIAFFGTIPKLYHSLSGNTYAGYVEFEAKAGRTYRLQHTLSGERVWSWIVDQDTGEVVAGEKLD